jgi:polyferredoxin
VFLLGVLLGLAREFLVVRYYVSIQGRRALLGSGISLGIGLLDLVIIAKIMLDANLVMAIGYVLGEAVGTFLAVRLRKGDHFAE